MMIGLVDVEALVDEHRAERGGAMPIRGVGEQGGRLDAADLGVTVRAHGFVLTFHDPHILFCSFVAAEGFGWARVPEQPRELAVVDGQRYGAWLEARPERVRRDAVELRYDLERDRRVLRVERGCAEAQGDRGAQCR